MADYPSEIVKLTQQIRDLRKSKSPEQFTAIRTGAALLNSQQYLGETEWESWVEEDQQIPLRLAQSLVVTARKLVPPHMNSRFLR